MLIIKHLKTNSKGNPFTTDASTTTNTITTPAQTYKRSTAIMITSTLSTKITVKTATTATKIKRSEILKKTVIGLMKRQFTMKN